MATTTDQARIDPAAHIAAARTVALDAIIAAEIDNESTQVISTERLVEILDTFAAAARHAGVMEGMGFTIANQRPGPRCSPECDPRFVTTEMFSDGRAAESTCARCRNTWPTDEA